MDVCKDQNDLKKGETMRRSRVVVLGALVIALVFLPLFSSFAAEPKILKIGSTVPLKSKEGIQIKKWLELLAERQNRAGGLMVKGERYSVQMVVYDDEYSADAGRACAERLIYQDKVKHIICQWGSAPIVATLGLAEPNKVLQIGNGMTEKTMEPQYHYYYRAPSLFWSNGGQVFYVEYFKKLGLPMTAVIIGPDDATGRGYAEKAVLMFKNLGVKVLDNLFYKRETTDYTPFATKIKSLNPGYVDTGSTGAGAPTLLIAKALHDVGYRGGKIFNNMAETWREIVDKFGPEMIEGSLGQFKDPRQYRKEKWALELCDAYEKKYGVWETDAVNWIAGWFSLMAAIKKADSIEVEDLVKALNGLEVNTLDARQRFVARPDKNNTRTCDAVPEQPAGIMKDGKFQLLRMLSIEEDYSMTIRAFGLEAAYKLPK
jgi:ABC-type branched-subunit amino acid transport system substrate-binding protein